MAFDWGQFGSGLSQMGGGLAGLFGLGKGDNPADVANQYLNKIPGQMNPYYKPYQQAGLEAMKGLQGQYGDLLSGNVQNKLGESYKESPGYKKAMEAALMGSNNANAAGGMLGTGVNQQANMNAAGDVASKDYNSYLTNQMNLYGQGLQGQQGINQMGFGANTDFANMLGSLLGQQGQYGYAGQDAENKAGQANWANIFGGLGSLFGMGGNK